MINMVKFIAVTVVCGLLSIAAVSIPVQAAETEDSAISVVEKEVEMSEIQKDIEFELPEGQEPVKDVERTVGVTAIFVILALLVVWIVSSSYLLGLELLAKVELVLGLTLLSAIVPVIITSI